MRLMLPIAALVTLFVASQSAFGQPFEPDFRRPPSRDPVRAMPSGRAVTIDVTVIDTSDERLANLSGDELVARLRELERELDSVSHIRLTTLDQLPAMVQFGDSVAVETGRSFGPGGGGFGGGGRGGGGPSQTTYTFQNVGTMVKATPRIEGRSVVLEINFERSQLARRAAAEGEEAPPPGMDKMTAQSTVTIPQGESVLVGGKKTRSGDKTINTWILVSAAAGEGSTRGEEPRRIGRSGDPEDRQEVRVIRLQSNQAGELAEAVRRMWRGEVDFDARTNTITLRGGGRELQRIADFVEGIESRSRPRGDDPERASPADEVGNRPRREPDVGNRPRREPRRAPTTDDGIEPEERPRRPSDRE
jgi:hypothetical protein